MNQIDSMAIPVEGRMTTEELFELKNKMNTKALAKRRSKTVLRVVANIVFAVVILLIIGMIIYAKIEFKYKK